MAKLNGCSKADNLQKMFNVGKDNFPLVSKLMELHIACCGDYSYTSLGKKGKQITILCDCECHKGSTSPKGEPNG